jgi:nitronate monooxygenase
MGTRVCVELHSGQEMADTVKQFIPTTESPAPEAVKQTIVTTTDGASSTVKSTAHDVFQSTNFWPAAYDGRAIIGKAYEDFKAGLPDEENVAKYKDNMIDGDASRRVVWA